MGTFQQMWNYMHTHEDVFTKSNYAGIERVKQSNGGYAFLMESSSIEYIMERDCNLAKVGGELDSKSYGIGMKKNAPFKGEINQAILKLQENGKLHMLKNKWWKQKGAKNCKVLFFIISCFVILLFIFSPGLTKCPKRSKSPVLGKCQWGLPCSYFGNGFGNCNSFF